MPRTRALRSVIPIAAIALAAAACGGGAAGSADGPVVIGASMSLSGSLGVLGPPLEAGYQQAVADVNAAGGVSVDGTKKKVRLVVLDNGSDPNKASSQARELVLKDQAVALLGFTTPPIVTPTALAAEQQRIPFVTSLTPVRAFQQGGKGGWKYAWDLFFDEKDQAAMAAKALAMAKGNKKVVLFTDNEPDGAMERPMYKAAFQARGLNVAGDYTFPVGTTDYSSFITSAKAKGAQLLAAQMTPADGVALWKQLRSFHFAPQAAFVAKASDAEYWWETLDRSAQGTLSEGYWSPSAEPASAIAVVKKTLGKKYGMTSGNMAGATMAYTAATVLTQAITRAGSTDPDRLNTAIGNTDAQFPGGHITFDRSTHTATTPYYVTQWQKGVQLQVTPPLKGVTFEQPTAGLQER